jgi:hypothetical protein
VGAVSPTTKSATVLVAMLASVSLAACGGDEERPAEPDAGAGAQPVVEDPGPAHVHGLGVNPSDGALFIATHTGLFRAAPGERRSERVADRYQDTMGFTVVGPDRFLGSGHPDTREDLPPFLGLIESRDAGETWQPVSLLGEVDFHVLEASGKRVYGFGSNFETRRATLLVSNDAGRNWDERPPPEPLVDLAIDPSDPDRALAAGESSLHVTRDAGRTWTAVEGPVGLLAWPARRTLYVVAADGVVHRSSDGGRSFRSVGDVGSEPAAAHGEGARDVYVALHDGTIKHSSDRGATWSVRAVP